MTLAAEIRDALAPLVRAARDAQIERDVAELTYLHKAHDRGLGNKNWKDTVYKEVQA